MNFKNSYVAPEVFQLSVIVESGFAGSSTVDPGGPGGELLSARRTASYDDEE